MDQEALLKLFDAIIDGLENADQIDADYMNAIRKARQDFEDGSKPPLDQRYSQRNPGYR